MHPISKYMNSFLPTLYWLQMIDNKMDGQCFDCGLLWEVTNLSYGAELGLMQHLHHGYEHIFHQQLQKQHTPDIMAILISNCMTNWLNRMCIPPPTWQQPKEPIMADLKCAFESWRRIGWGYHDTIGNMHYPLGQHHPPPCTNNQNTKLAKTTLVHIPGHHQSDLWPKLWTWIISFLPGLQRCMCCGSGVIW